WNAPQEAIYTRCVDDLERLGFPGIRSAMLGHFASFVEEGYPVYHLEYRADRETVLGFVGQVENLLTCGRQGAFRYVFMDTAMEMGIAAAEALRAAHLGAGAGRRISDIGSERGLIEAKALTA